MRIVTPFILIVLLSLAVHAVADEAKKTAAPQAAIPVVPLPAPEPTIENGDPHAIFARAFGQLGAQGKEKDNLEAAKWLTLFHLAGGSAEDEAKLQERLAAAKLTPEELEQGKILARDWLRKEAIKLSPGILRILMHAYGKGAFGEPSADEAYFWFLLLQEKKKDASPVIDGVGDITQMVSPHDQDAIKELVRKWKLNEIPAYMKEGYNPDADPATQGSGEVEETASQRRYRETLESDVRRTKKD